MENNEITQTNEEYGASDIQVLEGLEAVRKRPGMYIGSTGPRGLHHLVYEIVDNAIDEALAGYCDKIDVRILPGDIIVVEDNGRGIPVGIQPKMGIPAVTVVFTVLHAGGKFGGGGYKVSGGLHGVGASVVNALSTWLEVEVSDGAHIYRQRFERGKTITDLEMIGDTTKTGTKVTFQADPEIFSESTVYEYETLETRLREQAFLNAGIHIELVDERDPENRVQKNFLYEGGISSFVEFLHKRKSLEVIHPDIIHVKGALADGSAEAEVAMQYNESYNELLISFANNIHTTDGGTHEEGFKRALTRIMNDYARKYNILKDGDKNLSGEDVREGLTAIISVKLKEAQFEGQTKAKLGNTEIRTLVDNLIKEFDQTEANALVIDFKDDQGRITCPVDSPVASEIGACRPYVQDMKELIASLKERGLYVIARVVAFRDPWLAEKKPEWSLHLADGSLYRDRQGMAWVDPYRKEVWDYLVEVGTEAKEAGFDEVQFDYIRFSTEGTMRDVVFDEAVTGGRSKTDVITEFVKYAYENLASQGLFVSADVFGTIIGSDIDAQAVGQVYTEMAKHLDYICPMIYPSHATDRPRLIQKGFR